MDLQDQKASQRQSVCGEWKCSWIKQCWKTLPGFLNLSEKKILHAEILSEDSSDKCSQNIWDFWAKSIIWFSAWIYSGLVFWVNTGLRAPLPFRVFNPLCTKKPFNHIPWHWEYKVWNTGTASEPDQSNFNQDGSSVSLSSREFMFNWQSSLLQLCKGNGRKLKPFWVQTSAWFQMFKQCGEALARLSTKIAGSRPNSAIKTSVCEFGKGIPGLQWGLKTSTFWVRKMCIIQNVQSEGTQ